MPRLPAYPPCVFGARTRCQETFSCGNCYERVRRQNSDGDIGWARVLLLGALLALGVACGEWQPPAPTAPESPFGFGSGSAALAGDSPRNIVPADPPTECNDYRRKRPDVWVEDRPRQEGGQVRLHKDPCWRRAVTVTVRYGTIERDVRIGGGQSYHPWTNWPRDTCMMEREFYRVRSHSICES